MSEYLTLCVLFCSFAYALSGLLDTEKAKLEEHISTIATKPLMSLSSKAPTPRLSTMASTQLAKTEHVLEDEQNIPVASYRTRVSSSLSTNPISSTFNAGKSTSSTDPSSVTLKFKILKVTPPSPTSASLVPPRTLSIRSRVQSPIRILRSPSASVMRSTASRSNFLPATSPRTTAPSGPPLQLTTAQSPLKSTDLPEDPPLTTAQRSPKSTDLPGDASSATQRSSKSTDLPEDPPSTTAQPPPKSTDLPDQFSTTLYTTWFPSLGIPADFNNSFWDYYWGTTIDTKGLWDYSWGTMIDTKEGTDAMPTTLPTTFEHSSQTQIATDQLSTSLATTLKDLLHQDISEGGGDVTLYCAVTVPILVAVAITAGVCCYCRNKKKQKEQRKTQSMSRESSMESNCMETYLNPAFSESSNIQTKCPGRVLTTGKNITNEIALVNNSSYSNESELKTSGSEASCSTSKNSDANYASIKRGCYGNKGTGCAVGKAVQYAIIKPIPIPKPVLADDATVSENKQSKTTFATSEHAEYKQ